MMKKYILLFLIFVLFLSGCSKSSDSISAENSQILLDKDYLMQTYGNKSNNDYGEAEIAYESGENFVLTSGTSAQNIQRKIVKNANVRIEVQEVEQAYENILENLEEHGGYEASKSLESYSENNIEISAELKIPAEYLDNFMNDLASEGELKSQNIYSSDITDQYYDSQTRLQTLEKTLAKYYTFLDEAKTVKDQLEISNYISDLTYQIESLKGSLNRWDFIVEYSSVSIYIYKKYNAADTRVIEWSSLSLDDMGYLIKSGFVGTSSFIVNMLQLFLVALIAGSPVIIPCAVIIFFIIRRIIKKRRAKSKEQSNIPEQSEVHS